MKETTVQPGFQLETEQLANVLPIIETKLRAVGDEDRARRLVELRRNLDRPDLRIVVFGEFNRGKSTLINALLGRMALPARLVPTTGHVTQVVYGRNERVRVRYVDQREEFCSLEQIDRIASLDVHGAARDDVEFVEVVLNHPLLRDQIEFIDTPGLNEHVVQTRRAKSAIALADLVV